MWPGTPDAKNPFFSPATAQLLRQEWEAELQKLILNDDDEYPQQNLPVYWARRLGALAGPANVLRETDATLNDYY
jgi:hypothetical protein